MTVAPTGVAAALVAARREGRPWACRHKGRGYIDVGDWATLVPELTVQLRAAKASRTSPPRHGDPET